VARQVERRTGVVAHGCNTAMNGLLRCTAVQQPTPHTASLPVVKRAHADQLAVCATGMQLQYHSQVLKTSSCSPQTGAASMYLVSSRHACFRPTCNIRCRSSGVTLLYEPC